MLFGGAAALAYRAGEGLRFQHIRRGVALYVVNRDALLRQALVDKTDDPFDSIPMDGFRREAFNAYYSAYVRC